MCINVEELGNLHNLIFNSNDRFITIIVLKFNSGHCRVSTLALLRYFLHVFCSATLYHMSYTHLAPRKPTSKKS